ncbi:MAG TPA: hypothetical protein VMA98_04710, partial [Candidatus Acidoferrales bacterium]|nr:hypothetical protein [Candidatus Acidoferrales bacterium]
MFNAERISELLAEAQEDLQKYDALRANTLQMIETYKKRLQIIGKGDEPMLPLTGVESEMKEPVNNTALFRTVLKNAPVPLTAKQVWEYARKMGASTSSNNPVRLTDAVLRGLIRKGEVIQPKRGLFAPSNNK